MLTLDEVERLERLWVNAKEAAVEAPFAHALRAKRDFDAEMEASALDLLALARRALESDSARARWEAALKTAPREPDADDMRDAAAAECRKIADRPPKGSDRAEQELWREACEHCADRVEAVELRVVSRLVLPDAGEGA